MRSVHQRLGCGAIHARQVHVQAGGDAVGVGNGAEVDFGVNRQVRRQG